MKRKVFWGIIFLVAAGLGGLWWHLRNVARARAVHEVMEQVRGEMQNQWSGLMTRQMTFLGLEQHASLEGDTTTLALTLTNRNTVELSEVVVDAIKLGGVVPVEKADLPLKLDRLAPASSRALTLHFERVPWNLLGGGPYARANASLDLHEQWANAPVPSQPLSTNTSVNSGVSRQTSDYQGIQVELDKPSVNALQKRAATLAR